jgi:integrase
LVIHYVSINITLFHISEWYQSWYQCLDTMLTNKKIDGSKPAAKPYKLADAHGLYIAILPSGTKSWRTNYKSEGKAQTKTFGQYPGIGVADARRLNTAFKDELANGMAKSSPTFDEVKEDWYKHKLPKLRNLKHQQQVRYRLDTFASPILGKKPIDAIKRADLVKVVQSIQDGGIIETAHRVGTHLRQLFDYALDIGKIESHSANNLSRVLQAPVVKHMNCVPMNQVKDLFTKIKSIEEPLNRLGLIFIALTFVRSSEARYMKRDEIKDERFWVIPAVRMKGKAGNRKPHVVPLSNYALKVLEEIDIYTGDSDFVFQSPVRPNKPISENCLLDALYGLGYRHKMTVHGFRALASTVLNEQSPFSHDVIERQLAHKETDAVRAAYNRAEYLDERIKLMDWWSNWVAQHLA